MADQPTSIRDHIGEIHAGADQISHLAQTMRDHILSDAEVVAMSDADLARMHCLLGLTAEVADRINMHAEAMSQAQMQEGA